MPSPDPPAAGAPAAAIDALLAVLRPLARLAIDHGVQFGQLQELAKQAMVEAAMRATAGDEGRGEPPVSRLSVMTGIHRKEVKRLAESPDLESVRATPAPAAELFTRWIADPAYRDADGRPTTLPRRAGEDGRPSFERLSRSVTTDVHPRTLLDELMRLQLVEVDPETDEVRLRRDAFVPSGRIEDMLGFVGANVGDHLAAARDNVAASAAAALSGETGARPPFVEQALYADALSAGSAARAVERARAHWHELLRQAAPELQRLEDEDRAAGRPAGHRVRIGLYCYAEPLPPAHGGAGDGSPES